MLLRKAGANRIVICDSKGIISRQRDDLSENKQKFAVSERGNLADAMQDADIFLGVSAPGVVTPEMVHTMAEQPIVFAMANPIPRNSARTNLRSRGSDGNRKK